MKCICGSTTTTNGVKRIPDPACPFPHDANIERFDKMQVGRVEFRTPKLDHRELWDTYHMVREQAVARTYDRDAWNLFHHLLTEALK